MVDPALNECFDAIEPWDTEETSGTAVPLDELADNQGGIILKVIAGRNALMRLCNLGLTPKAWIQKLHSAPMGGPVEIRVRDTLLAIGRGLARQILVSVGGDDDGELLRPSPA